MNWVQVCHDAVSASADEGRACRACVERDPDDLTARVQRIGQLFLDLEPDAQAERAEHLCWWVRHRPDVDLGGFGFVDRTSFQEAYEAVRGAWRAALEAHPTDVDVLLAAVAFLGVYEPEEAEPLARRAMGLSPERAKGPQVVVLRRLGRWAEALAVLDGCAELGVSDVIDVAQCCVKTGDLARAERTARELLRRAEDLVGRWDHGNAIHKAHVTLGWVALLRDGDTEGACRALEDAGRAEGSPQLDSFGPDLELAHELLERGCREEVVRYLDACRRFWKDHDLVLDEWIAVIRAGRDPWAE